MDVETFLLNVKALADDIKEQHYTNKPKETCKSGSGGQPDNPHNHIKKLVELHGIPASEKATAFFQIIYTSILQAGDQLPDAIFKTLAWKITTRHRAMKSIEMVSNYEPIIPVIEETAKLCNISVQAYHEAVSYAKSVYWTAYLEERRRKKESVDEEDGQESLQEVDVESVDVQEITLGAQQETVGQKQPQEEKQSVVQHQNITLKPCQTTVADETELKMLKEKVSRLQQELKDTIKHRDELNHIYKAQAEKYWELIVRLTVPKP